MAAHSLLSASISLAHPLQQNSRYGNTLSQFYGWIAFGPRGILQPVFPLDVAFGATDLPRLSPLIRKHFKGPIVLNSDYDLKRAKADLDSGLADAISFGRAFLANPDLVDRLRHDAPLNQAHVETYYSQEAAGYTDYPALPKNWWID